MTLLALASKMDLNPRNRAGGTTVAPVTEGFLGLPTSQAAGLCNGFSQGVAVIGIAVMGIGPEDPGIFGAAED